MATLYLPTEEDRAALQEMLAEWRARVRGSTRRPAVPGEEGSAAEVLVARVPYGGIAGMDENTTGTETSSETVESYLQDDVLSYADCVVYRKVLDNGVSTLAPTGLTKRVYNLSANAIEGQQWILITKDKWGDWYATSPINASDVSSGSSGSSAGVAFVRITSSTPATGNLYTGDLQNYTVAGGYSDTGVTVRVQFPNNEVPGLARVAAVDSGETSGGFAVYKSVERPLTVAATDAGTGDSNATYYGISTLNVNQGSGFALTNSSLSCKVAAQSASATHSGVVDLVDGQILGANSKIFNKHLYIHGGCYVNMNYEANPSLATQTGVAFSVSGTSLVPAIKVVVTYVASGNDRCGVFLNAIQEDAFVSNSTGRHVRTGGVNTSVGSPVYGETTTLTVNGSITTSQHYRVGAGTGVPGISGQYLDGFNTRVVAQGGLVTGVF